MSAVKNFDGTTILNGNEGSTDPASGAFAVTTSNSTEYTSIRALWVGTGGNIALDMDGTVVVLKNVADGTLLPVSPLKVRATSTTAADIIALT